MAFKKTLVQRLFNLSRFSTPSLCRNPSGKPQLYYPTPARIVNGLNSNRAKNSRTFYQSAEMMRLFPMTRKTFSDTMKRMDITRGRLNLDGLVAYPKYEANNPSRLNLDGLVAFPKDEATDPSRLTISDVNKVLMATQVEMITEKLRNVGKDWVTYKEFVGIIEGFCGENNKERVIEFAKSLDDCGNVIVFGNYVCLCPLQVAKAIHNLVTPSMPMEPNDPRMKELELMEEQKAEIDRKAEAFVRRELWAGLGYMAVQTATLMRLTLWELSWDVMEPVCFFVTSAYFMLGYTFFLRTSKEPSFERFFQSRFNSKQKRLMKAQEFDLERYNDLRLVFYPHFCPSSSLDNSKLIKLDY